MPPKSSLLFVSLSTWMYAAVSCAALPFCYAVPQLKAMGGTVPLLAALVVGALVSIPLSLIVRRMSGFSVPEKNVWSLLTAREAAAFGVMSWGVPVGLMFVVNEFLDRADPIAVIPAVVIWPLAGIAFGLLARWLAQRRGARELQKVEA
jgi:hypothetical protein